MRSPKIFPYLVAILAVALAAGINQLILSPWMGERTPFGLLTMAIIVTAWLGGLLPGLVATAFSILLGSHLLVTPSSSTTQQLILIVIFFLNGCLISLVCELLRLSRGKAEAAREEIRQGHLKAEKDSRELLKNEQAARKEAERTALLKDEFLATVSHEMRTPLTAILGWVQLLRSGSLAGDTVPQALETIERNARAQSKMIDDLLHMSRILSGRLSLDLQRTNPAQAVEAALAAAEPAAAAQKIQLKSQIDPKISHVSGDDARLQQIVENLLSNAIKFTPIGGIVTVAVSNVNSHVEISVSDTGQGITSEFLPHVFDHFRQQDASTVRKHKGLGLGLSIVKQLTELHGGSVCAESEGQDRGARFVVALPVFGGKALRPSGRSPNGENLPSLLGAKVLVVEDDSDVRELLRSILAQNGASVRTAASTPEALKQFEARCPDVLVSDIGMPEQDGYDLIRKIRSLDPEAGGQTPAVALTAFTRPSDRNRVIAEGYHLHLSKPIEPPELVKAVASLIGSEKESV